MASSRQSERVEETPPSLGTSTPRHLDTSRASREAARDTPRRVWLDGQLVDQADARISVYDHGLLYGDGCFEGIRAYGGRIFKLASHLKRMYASAERIRLKPAYSPAQIAQAVRQTIEANDLPNGYIRLIFTRGAGTLGLHPFRCPKPGTIVIVDRIQIYPEELYRQGMKVIVARRPRIPIACLDPAIKSLNYLNNVLAKIEAIDADVLEAIMLNVDGYVSECTGDNIFMVKGGELFTPPAEAGILHGVTRQFVLQELAPALHIAARQKMLRLDDLLQADEVFLTGTAAEIIGVNQIDQHPIGKAPHQVGPITKKLAEEFRQRVSKNAPED